MVCDDLGYDDLGCGDFGCCYLVCGDLGCDNFVCGDLEYSCIVYDVAYFEKTVLVCEEYL